MLSGNHSWHSIAAAGEREDVQIADVGHRVVVDLLELSGAFAGQAREAGALEPVLLFGRTSVVGCAAVGEDGTEARALTARLLSRTSRRVGRRLRPTS